MRSWGRWVSEIRIPHSRDKIWLGSYSMPELAARAYDTAYLLLRGPSPSSSLNLSDSSLLITPHLAPYTNSPHAITRRVIQIAAAEIANAIAGVGNPLQVCPDTEAQGMATPERDAENIEETCRDILTPNSMEEQDLVSMESLWINDALNLLSPRKKMNLSFFSGSAAASNRLQGVSSLSCASEQGLKSAGSLELYDEFHQALHLWLAQDGFTPISDVVTTRVDLFP